MSNILLKTETGRCSLQAECALKQAHPSVHPFKVSRKALQLIPDVSLQHEATSMGLFCNCLISTMTSVFDSSGMLLQALLKIANIRENITGKSEKAVVTS